MKIKGTIGNSSSSVWPYRSSIRVDGREVQSELFMHLWWAKLWTKKMVKRYSTGKGEYFTFEKEIDESTN